MTYDAAKKYVDSLLDRAALKDFFLTDEERSTMMELLQSYPTLLLRSGPKRMFTSPRRKKDMDGFDGTNG